MVFYKVIVDENFHFMDEDESCTAAEYTSAEEAGVHCKKIIDDYLDRVHKSGMSANDLWRSWSGFGESPRISGPAEFSVVEYTKQPCEVLCAGGY